MPEITDNPEFQEWLEVQLGNFPAPSPEVARQLADLIGVEHTNHGADAPNAPDRDDAPQG